MGNILRRFPTFLAVLESKYSGGNTLDTVALTEAIDDLYQIYVENVIKKANESFIFYIIKTTKHRLTGNLCVSGILDEERLPVADIAVLLVRVASWRTDVLQGFSAEGTVRIDTAER